MRFNKFSLLGFGALFALLAVTWWSCEGETPEPDDIRDKYVDQWSFSEVSSQIGPNTYVVQISKSTTNTDQVFLENLYNIGFAYKATATVSGNNITIPSQIYNGNTLTGNGTLSATSNTINLTYYMNNGTTIDTCSGTLTRQ